MSTFKTDEIYKFSRVVPQRGTYLLFLLWCSGWDSQRDTAQTSSCTHVCVFVCVCARAHVHACLRVTLTLNQQIWNGIFMTKESTKWTN